MSENYQNFTDDELIQMVKESDCEAYAQLSSRYIWLIRLKAAGFEGTMAPEKEDLVQEGFLGLFLAANSYCETYGTSFKTYAGVCIENRMISAVRLHGNSKNRLLSESISLDSVDATGILGDESPENLLEIRENFKSIIMRMRLSLSPLEQNVFRLYLSGVERSEVSKKIGIPLKVFDNALHRARSKIKKL